MQNVRRVFLATAVATFLVTPAFAQTASSTQGFHLGAALNGSYIQLDEDDVGDSEMESGAGLSLYVGYNFTPNIGLILSGTGANIDAEGGGSYTLAHGDLGLRFSLSATPKFVPYAEAAYSGLSAKGDVDGDDVEFTGGGFTGALGFNFFMTQRLALDLNFKYTKGEFNTVKIGGQSVSDDDGIGVSTGRFNIGIAFYPSAGKSRSSSGR